MNTFLPMLKNVIIFVLIGVPGFILVKTKILKLEHSNIFSKLLVYVGSPFFVIFNMLDVNFTSETTTTLLWVCLLFTFCTISFYFASILLSKVKNKDNPLLADKQSRMMRFCQIFCNNGFMGLPLALAVFPKALYPNLIAFLIICNIVGNVLMYTFGLSLTSGEKKQINIKKILLNPVLIAFVISIPLNLLNVKKYLPELQSYSGYFNNVVTPLAMTVLGMKMAGIKFKKLFSGKKVYIVCAVKLLLFPVIAVAIAFAGALLFPAQRVDLILCIFIAFATPTAALATTFADQYDGDSEGAATYTLATTLLSVITIPLLYLALCYII